MTLDAALVTYAELAAGEQRWRTWSDPFSTVLSDPRVPAEQADANDETQRS
ncbi:MAG: hypothetical protein ACRDSR_16745 [Pseudonocardiaceae bacterium]